MPIRILICEDDVFARGGFESVLSGDPDFDVVATTSPADAIDRAMVSRPRLALIGSEIDDGHGLDLIRWFGTNLPGCRCVVLGSHLVATEIDDYLHAGAVTVETKGRSCSDVLDTFRRIASGAIAVPDRMPTGSNQINESAPRPLPELSPTDRRMLQLVVRGLTNSQIAAHLHYSHHTVRNRMSRLFRIMGVSNRTQLALVAQQYLGIRL